MPLEVPVNMPQVGSVDEFVGRYQSEFSKGFGTLKGAKASINVVEGVRPIFSRLHTICFALQDLDAQELQRVERDGISTAVRTSEWVAPIVPVLKKDSTIKICGDFNLAVNRVATTEVYPVLRLVGMWVKLAGA